MIIHNSSENITNISIKVKRYMKASESLSAITEQFMSGFEQVSSVSDNQRTIIGTVLDEANQIKYLAGNVKESISIFKIKGENN